MRKLILGSLTVLLIFSFSSIYAQSPRGKHIGFGLMFGEPTGGTLKIMSNNTNAFVIDVGSSYFGSPRINADYIWQFNAFNSDIANLYAGPGVAIGIGEGSGIWYKEKNGFYYHNGTGFGIRGVIGVNFIPRRSPFEIFGEMGVLIGLSPTSGSALDAAVGVRFYP